MPDYGHPIRFGVFVTPTNSPAARPVDLAVAAEDAGLDLVTYQDHPYQPGFLDTWTLISYAAARTERVVLSGNVLNLPLRQPAVLARAAASLDLLTGGRVALGLGGGALWDAIEAMGGPRLTPGETVQALDEAIEVIRGVWDAGNRTPLRVDGEFHRVAGAKRGPAPAHPIPIWLGAYKPRMLRLIAAKADGWLPSLGYLKPGDLSAGNRTIDEAATAAGRHPGEITRLLNVGPDQSIDELVELATHEGISTFIVAADDARTIEVIGREVAPRVRDQVAEARASSGVSGAPVRSAAALAARLPGIAYDQVPDGVETVEPGDFGYDRYRSTFMRGGEPGLVLRPSTPEQVSAAVGFAAEHREVPLGIFSAGHGISGRSVNKHGLVIDVGALNHIEVLNAETGLVRIGPGARWVEVATALAPYGLAITSGDYGGVGVGGLATAGGVGWFAREHGLTIDHLASVEVVLADGSRVRASQTENADLFWGMRGAGANFGVAVDFEFTAAKVGEIAFAQFTFDASDTVGFLQAWGEQLEAADRSVTGQILMGPPQGGQMLAQAKIVVDDDEPDSIIAKLQPIAEIAPLLDQSVGLTSYDRLMEAFVSDQPQAGMGEPHGHSATMTHLSEEFAVQAAGMLRAGASYFFQIRALGGAVCDVPSDATAFAPRGSNFAVSAMGTTASGVDQWWQRITPLADGLYVSFETDTGAEVVSRAFPGDHLHRLRGLKLRYDPTGLFRDNFFIDPS